MQKKLLILLLSLAVVLPATAATVYDFMVDGIAYNKNGSEATVTYKSTSYNSYSGSVTIPSTVTYNGVTYTVTAIGDNAFRACSSLASITIPSSVSSIGIYAFYQCTRLASVIIPNTVNTINNYSFSGCTGLTNVTIPNSVTTIGQSAFYGCSGLISVTIPDFVTTIGQSAFQNCSGLTNVTLSNSLLTIGKSAFYGCKSLASVSLPNSLKTIGASAFYTCTGLKSVDIPNSVTSIGDDAFHNCNGLTGLIIGNSVTSIGNSAFNACTGLTSLIIPNSVTSIGEYAFVSCTGLTSVCFGNSVKTLGQYAFRSCTGLTNITIPNSITSIGHGAFAFCVNLMTLNFNAENCADFISNTSNNNYNTFHNCPLETIIIGDEVTKIPNYLTVSCDKSKLTTLIIGKSVSTIGTYAFQSCTGLTSLTLPCSINTIGSNAFASCTNLKTIYISGEGEWKAGTLPMNTSITTLYIGSDITLLSDMRVNPTDIYCYAAVPPTCHSNAFTGYTGTLHVPASSYATYCFALTWENFTDVVAGAVEPQTVRLNKTSLDMLPTEQQTLTATVQPTGAYPNSPVLWWSSDPNVATVVNGVVTAVAPGECDIYASCYPVKSKCHVVVADMSSHIVITLDQHEAEVKVNHMINLIPTMTPEETDLVVTSSDPTVAGARIVNGNVRVVGIHVGTTTITVASADGTAQPDTCLVTVFTDPGDLNGDGSISITDVTNLINLLLTQDVIENPYADVNGDGVVNIKDVTTLINILLSSD